MGKGQMIDGLWNYRAGETFRLEASIEFYFQDPSFVARCPFPENTTAFDLWCTAHPLSFVAMNARRRKEIMSLASDFDYAVSGHRSRLSGVWNDE